MLPRRSFLQLTAGALAPAALAQSSERPNVVLIYADDAGFGDLSCYGATKVKTPNLDRLAAQGIRFTDAHSSAATCTPSRFSLLTGEYSFRNPGATILPGDARAIIEPGRFTLASLFQQAGYETGVVGKWHLGLGKGNLDWNGPFAPGPNEIGFGYSFLIPATGDRVPCVYTENGRVVGLDPADPIRVDYRKPTGPEPTGKANPELLKMHPSHGHDMTIVNGVSRIGYMSGGKSALWVDEDMADVITKKATDFIDRNVAKPFFLYFATHDIHVPRLPHKRFLGSTQCGVRCDAMAELDWSVGEIVKALERHNLTRNTIVIFTSDNGPVVDDGYKDGAVENLNGHTPHGGLRGGKYSAYEAGTRMPFLVRWPARIKAGTTSGALISQVDLMGSFAALLGRPLAGEAGPDSFNVLPALTGRSRVGRDHLVQQSRGITIRKGTWKLVPAGAEIRAAAGLPTLSSDNAVELYDLERDRGETRNVAAAHPEVVAELTALLERIKAGGRGRP